MFLFIDATSEHYLQCTEYNLQVIPKLSFPESVPSEKIAETRCRCYFFFMLVVIFFIPHPLEHLRLAIMQAPLCIHLSNLNPNPNRNLEPPNESKQAYHITSYHIISYHPYPIYERTRPSPFFPSKSGMAAAWSMKRLSFTLSGIVWCVGDEW